MPSTGIDVPRRPLRNTPGGRRKFERYPRHSQHLCFHPRPVSRLEHHRSRAHQCDHECRRQLGYQRNLFRRRRAGPACSQPVGTRTRQRKCGHQHLANTHDSEFRQWPADRHQNRGVGRRTVGQQRVSAGDIAAGQSSSVTVTFAPASMGTFAGSIAVTTNLSTSPSSINVKPPRVWHTRQSSRHSRSARPSQPANRRPSA